MSMYTEDDLRRALTQEATTAPPPIDVWGNLRRRVSVRRWRRTGVAVGLAGVAAAVLLSALPGGDDPTRLSTAHGGAVTWVPDRPLSDAELQQAVEVLRQRLDTAGVAGAEIQTQDGSILLRAPHLDGPLAAGLMSRGVVQFRPVLAVQPPGQHRLSSADAPTLSEAERAFSGAGCPVEPPRGNSGADASHYLIACSSDEAAEYLLGPTALDNAAIAQAQPVQDQNTGEWLALVSFTPAGRRDFRAFTADAAEKPPVEHCGPPRGCNSIGILVDGIVVGAPMVQGRGGIAGGQMQIAAGGTKEEAELLAVWAATQPLPTGFTAGSSTTP